jgi:hypothetical protein
MMVMWVVQGALSLWGRPLGPEPGDATSSDRTWPSSCAIMRVMRVRSWVAPPRVLSVGSKGSRSG